MRFPRLMLAASGLATAALLGSSVAANAAPMSATINGPITNPADAGYQVQSSVSFNDVRATVDIPAGAVASSFIVLQPDVNGGATFALGLVNDGKGNYLLEGVEGTTFHNKTGVPFVPSETAANLVPLPTLGVPARHPLFTSKTGGTYFLEIHYSTRRNLVQFVAGPSETANAVLKVAHGGFFFSGIFNAPAVETVNFGGGKLPVRIPQGSITVPDLFGPQAFFSRVGLTEPAGSNFGGIAGTRITFDNFPLDEAEATANGGPVTIGNHFTLRIDPALPSVGSAFGVIAGR